MAIAQPTAGAWISPAHTGLVGSPVTSPPHRSVPPDLESTCTSDSHDTANRAAVGESGAPVLPIVVGLSLVLIRMLKLDVDRSKQERQIRRLTQKLAILEEEIERLGAGRTPMRPTQTDSSAH